jgi:negative regulator of replication initiation
MKETIHFRIDKDLYDFIKSYAKQKRMSVSQVVRNCILEFYEKKQSATIKEHQT